MHRVEGGNYAMDNTNAFFAAVQKKGKEDHGSFSFSCPWRLAQSLIPEFIILSNL
jgi:hypothetical protein